MIQHPRSLPHSRRRRAPTQSFILVAVLLPIWLLVGCQTTRDEVPFVELPAGSFARAWTADLRLPANDRVTGLTVLDDQVIVQTRNNLVYGISAGGGTIRWSSQVLAPGRTLGRPTLAGDRIVFSSVDRLIVYSRNGQRQRDIELARAVRSPVTGAGDFVYVGFDYVGQGRLGRVSLTEPYAPLRWELMTRGAVNGAPAVFQDTVFAGSHDGNVYAVGDERAPLWATPGNVFSTGGPISADIRADDTGVYVASGDSKLYALDRQTGRIRWQYFAGQPLRTAPTVTDDSVYQFVPGKGLVALDKHTGAYNRQPRWVYDSGTEALAQDAQRVYLRRTDNNIVAVDRRTGKPAFSTRRGDLSVFAGGQGLVYASTPGGLVMGIRAVTGGGTTGQMVSVPIDATTERAGFGG